MRIHRPAITGSISATNLIVSGTITAEGVQVPHGTAVSSSFAQKSAVSSSFVQGAAVSGSFVTSSAFTGNMGDISGSSISTGSFGKVDFTHLGGGNLTFDGTDMAIESSTAVKPLFKVTNTTNNITSAELRFNATKAGNNGVDNDQLGKISFWGQDGGGNNQNFLE